MSVTSSPRWIIRHRTYLPLERVMRLHVSASLLVGGWDLTYPFYIYDLSSRFKPGYKLVFVDDHNNIVRVQSNACTGTFIVSAIAGTCSTCQVLGPLFEIVHTLEVQYSPKPSGAAPMILGGKSSTRARTSGIP